MFHIQFVDKIKTRILCSVTFFQQPSPLWHNVEKYGTAGQATDDKIVWCIRTARWVPNTTDTHS
jgi:hypothetical protein